MNYQRSFIFCYIKTNDEDKTCRPNCYVKEMCLSYPVPRECPHITTGDSADRFLIHLYRKYESATQPSSEGKPVESPKPGDP